ncbi:MAG TPA: serine/threonine-protein kinase [Enhygromyxa sp.]|nr:serine/threonine-protein kinase [Enhygromyxa sp.]
MSKRREPELPERFEVLAADVRRAWGLHRINPDRHALHRIGRFEALRRLGQGTYGVVYKVRDPELGREVALKLFPTPSSAAADAFLREAQLLAKFSHPHIVRVFETGRYDDDFFFVMELVEGCTGHELILDWDDVDEVLEVYEAAGAGLAAAHAQSILHGDFKPSNVLLGDDDRVCVADFGLARLLAEHARVGTLPYMAPEVLRGEAGDARADQWSFCVALWETLHGLRPFAGETKEELLAAIERGQLDAGEHAERVPDAVRAVVRVGLAIDSGDRFADMQTLIATLRKLRGTADAEPSEAGGQRGVFFWAMLVSFGVMIGALGSAIWFAGREQPAAPAPRPMSAEPADEAQPVADPVVEHVLGLIAADEFEKAHEIWGEEYERRYGMGIPTGADSLRIADAFSERAAALEQRDPTRARAAARGAEVWSRIASEAEY